MIQPAAHFGGLIVPMLTPLTSDEHLDSPGLRRHIEFLIQGGADAIFILGSMGEGAMLRSSTRRAMVTETIDLVAGRKPVLCGVLEVSTSRIIEEVEQLQGHGLAGYVATTPLYFDGFSDVDLVTHFSRIAAGADAPVLLYNIPQFTRAALSEGLIRSLAEVANIAGLKDSSGNWPMLQRLLLDRPSERFAILQGFQPMSAISLFLGCDGLVPGYANLHPGLFVQLMAATREQDWRSALSLQKQLDRLLSFRASAPLHGSKVIGKALGLMDDNVTAPLPRLDGAAAALLVEASFAAGLPTRWDADVDDVTLDPASAEARLGAY